MKKIALISLIVAVVFLTVACSHREGVVLTEKYAYLQFLGDASNVTITVDDVALDIERYRKNLSKNHFQYEPGYHQVTVQRDGRLVLKQTVLLERGKITQVAIP
jgi:uncharacterized membrane protein